MHNTMQYISNIFSIYLECSLINTGLKLNMRAQIYTYSPDPVGTPKCVQVSTI